MRWLLLHFILNGVDTVIIPPKIVNLRAWVSRIVLGPSMTYMCI